MGQGHSRPRQRWLLDSDAEGKGREGGGYADAADAEGGPGGDDEREDSGEGGAAGVVGEATAIVGVGAFGH